MDKRALHAAGEALERLNDAQTRLDAAVVHRDFQAAWSDFLVAGHRIFSRIEQGAKQDSATRTWFDSKRRARKTDQLLVYIHQARHADEHGLAPSVLIQDFRAGKDVMPVYNFDGFDKDMKPIYSRTSTVVAPLEIVPSSATLHPVVNRGVTFQPPQEHLGQPIAQPSPQLVAELALSYFRAMVQEAGRLVRSSP